MIFCMKRIVTVIVHPDYLTSLLVPMDSNKVLKTKADMMVGVDLIQFEKESKAKNNKKKKDQGKATITSMLTLTLTFKEKYSNFNSLTATLMSTL